MEFKMDFFSVGWSDKFEVRTQMFYIWLGTCVILAKPLTDAFICSWHTKDTELLDKTKMTTGGNSMKCLYQV